MQARSHQSAPCLSVIERREGRVHVETVDALDFLLEHLIDQAVLFELAETDESRGDDLDLVKGAASAWRKT